MNLLKETIGWLEEYSIDQSKVLWVGLMDGSQVITWDEFKSIADIEYDHGFGCHEIVDNLVVVGKNWWLEQWEYDGSEGWEYKKLPCKSRSANVSIDDFNLMAL